MFFLFQFSVRLKIYKINLRREYFESSWNANIYLPVHEHTGESKLSCILLYVLQTTV